MHHVPDAGHDGVVPGRAKGVSMGSAAVPMRAQGKHDQLLRIAHEFHRRRRRRRAQNNILAIDVSFSEPRNGTTWKPSRQETRLSNEQCLWDPWATLVYLYSRHAWSLLGTHSSLTEACPGWLTGNPKPAARWLLARKTEFVLEAGQICLAMTLLVPL